MVKLEKEMWADFKPRAQVVIVGEGVNLKDKLQTLMSLIQLEMSPVRRTALVEMAAKLKGFDIDKLPKDVPVQPAPTQTQPKVASAPLPT